MRRTARKRRGRGSAALSSELCKQEQSVTSRYNIRFVNIFICTVLVYWAIWKMRLTSVIIDNVHYLCNHLDVSAQVGQVVNVTKSIVSKSSMLCWRSVFGCREAFVPNTRFFSFFFPPTNDCHSLSNTSPPHSFFQFAFNLHKCFPYYSRNILGLYNHFELCDMKLHDKKFWEIMD